MVGIKKVVYELKNFSNFFLKIFEDIELLNQDNSQVSLFDLGIGISVDSVLENQIVIECIIEDNFVDIGINIIEDSGKDDREI